MKLSKEQFIEELKKEANKIDIRLTEQQLEKLYLFKELLLEWNEKINLTSIVEDKQIILKHFIDSMNLCKYIVAKESVIDVGTGAGFPGMVIAIVSSENKVTLLDALNKRINFLNEVKTKLNLENVATIHGRAEEFAKDKENREQFDVVTSRAVASLNILLEYLSGYAKENAKLLIMKGKNVEEELKVSKAAEKKLKLKLRSVEKYTIVADDELFEHSIVIYSKTDKMPDKYPRNFAQIKKKSL